MCKSNTLVGQKSMKWKIWSLRMPAVYCVSLDKTFNTAGLPFQQNKGFK